MLRNRSHPPCVSAQRGTSPLWASQMRRKTGAPSEGAASRGGIPSEADSELGKGRGSRSREDCTGGIVAADGVDAVGVAETPSVFHVLSSAYIRKVHAPALSSLPVRLGIVLCFVALAVAGIVGTLHVRQGLQLSMLTR